MKSERIYLRVSAELKKALEEKAEADGRTLTNYITKLLTAAIKAGA